jgi:hypothetical protein
MALRVHAGTVPTILPIFRTTLPHYKTYEAIYNFTKEGAANKMMLENN